jgi:hypothetical protein
MDALTLLDRTPGNRSVPTAYAGAIHESDND